MTQGDKKPRGKRQLPPLPQAHRSKTLTTAGVAAALGPLPKGDVVGSRAGQPAAGARPVSVHEPCIPSRSEISPEIFSNFVDRGLSAQSAVNKLKPACELIPPAPVALYMIFTVDELKAILQAFTVDLDAVTNTGDLHSSLFCATRITAIRAELDRRSKPDEFDWGPNPNTDWSSKTDEELRRICSMLEQVLTTNPEWLPDGGVVARRNVAAIYAEITRRART